MNEHSQDLPGGGPHFLGFISTHPQKGPHELPLTHFQKSEKSNLGSNHQYMFLFLKMKILDICNKANNLHSFFLSLPTVKDLSFTN